MALKDQTEGQDEPINNGGAPDPTQEEAVRALNAMLEKEDEKHQGRGKKPEGEGDPSKPKIKEDPRDAISKNFRENRGAPQEVAEGGGEDVDPNSLAAQYGTDAVAAQTQDDQQQQQQDQSGVKPAAPAAIDPNTPVVVKVNGVDKTMTYAEVVKAAQKVEGADETFRAASELIKNLAGTKPASTPAKGSEDRQADADASTDETGKPASTPKGTKFSPEDLAKTVEAFTLGTTEEGAKALGELLEKVAQPAAPVDISNQVAFEIAANNVRTESTGAADAFLKKYPALADDPILQQVSGTLIATEMIKDLIAAGLSKEVIAEKLPTTQHIRTYYEAMRAHKPAFGRKMLDLMTAAEADPRFVALTGGKTVPLKVNLDRGDRKAALPPQPALRSPPNLQRAQQNDNQPVDIQASRQAAVARMREARGQRVRSA